MDDGIPESKLEDAMEKIEKFRGRGTPNEWEEFGDFSEIEVERSNSIYRIHAEGNTIEYRTGRGESFTETIGDMIEDDPVDLDGAARQNYDHIDQNLKAWELEPLTDDQGYLHENLRDDFEKLYHELK